MLTITLPPELEKKITAQAAQQGTTPELLSLEKLHQAFPEEEKSTSEPTPEGGETLADFLSEFIGSLDSGEIIPGGARMSENIGQKFAEGMAEKRKAGHL